MLSIFARSFSFLRLAIFPSPQYNHFTFRSCSSLAFLLVIFPFISLDISDKQESHGTTASKFCLMLDDVIKASSAILRCDIGTN